MRYAAAAWILAASALAAQTVEGLVVDAATGAGIPAVAVILTQTPETLPQGVINTPAYRNPRMYRATTDPQGRYRIEGVQEGDYTAMYREPNFWSVPNLLGTGRQQPFVVTSGGGAVRLEAKMHRIGEISGRVLDSTGKPVPGAPIWLRWGGDWCRLPACIGLLRQFKTDQKGEYRVTDLATPGTWSVSAAAPSEWPAPEALGEERLGWAHTYHSHEILVRPGNDHANLDIKLAAVPLRRIRGVVLDERGVPVPKTSVLLAKNFGPNLRNDTKADGTFEFEFAAATGEEWHLSSKVTANRVTLLATATLDIRGGELKDVELRLAAPFSIHGRVVMEAPEGIAAGKIPQILGMYAGPAQLSENPMGIGMSTSSAGVKGEFTMQNLYPGPYLFLPAGLLPPLFYLDSIRLGDNDAIRSGAVMVWEAQPLTVTYKTGGGTVRGTVESCASGDVFLVPQDATLRRAFIRHAPCSPNGRFEFRDVRPGEYYGYAISGDSYMPWEEAILTDRLLNEAARITVRGNEITTADVRVLTGSR